MCFEMSSILIGGVSSWCLKPFTLIRLHGASMLEQQFEIIDITNSDCVNIDNPCFPKQLKYGRPCLQGKRLYYRLLIRHKK